MKQTISILILTLLLVGIEIQRVVGGEDTKTKETKDVVKKIRSPREVSVPLRIF